MGFHLFEVFGVELEYMIVDLESGNVQPLCDELLRRAAGEIVSEVEMGELAWSNELALHVVELKTNGPARSLTGLASVFHRHVQQVNQLLKPLHARLMPTAMHPWMDPLQEMQLWPHDYNPVYEALNRIFNCRGHGWANLQSAHLNLPFAGDEEFGRLHAAIRLLLPIMPALSASSPLMNGISTGICDNRLAVYRDNSAKIPSITGQVIPEPVFTQDDYETQILQRIYRDIAPYDSDHVLQYEWLNARGAIARFDRNAIEIRVLDVQECPTADLAICQAVIAVLQKLVQETWTNLSAQKSVSTESLATLFNGCVRDAGTHVLRDGQYLRQFGIEAPTCLAGELWRKVLAAEGDSIPGLRTILQQGPLATRIIRSLAARPDSLKEIYATLCDSLQNNQMYQVSP